MIFHHRCRYPKMPPAPKVWRRSFSAIVLFSFHWGQNWRSTATAARSLSHKAHTPTSARLSNSISQWGADATEMKCGVCKVKFSWATKVDKKHVAASGCHFVFTCWRTSTRHLLSSVTVTWHFWTVTTKIKHSQPMWNIRPLFQHVRLKQKWLNYSSTMFDLGAYVIKNVDVLFKDSS